MTPDTFGMIRWLLVQKKGSLFGDSLNSTSCCLNQVGYPNGNLKKNAVIGLKSVAIQANNSGSSFSAWQDTWFEVVPNTNRFAMMCLH
jgi:hypothetical protein